MFGIWNTMKKEFQFGIQETSRSKAYIKLREKIGYDGLKYRFEVRKIPKEKVNV